jgi:hypothetical protein
MPVTFVQSSATGGSGASGATESGAPSFSPAGKGGNANAQATGIAAQDVTVSAIARGGNAGHDSGVPNPAGSASLSSGGLGPAVFGSSTNGGTVTVSGTAIAGNASTNGPAAGVSISLISNGGVNDAIGGATSGTLNLTQTAIGGGGSNGFDTGVGGNASSTLIGTNPYGSSNYNLTANATAGNGGGGSVQAGNGIGSDGGSATATVAATAIIGGVANATTNANGGAAGGGDFGGGNGGNATAVSTVIGPGSAVAAATGGSARFFGGINGGSASATATALTADGGIAKATATGGEGGFGQIGAHGGNATAIAEATSSATAIATGGQNRGFNGGGASALANVTNGGPAVAIATGGGAGDVSGPAVATSISTAMNGGVANATATATGGVPGCPGPPNCIPSGVAGSGNASSSATTINANLAQAQSTASGSSGQAQATAQTNIANLSIQPVATSQVDGSSPAIANAQAGGSIFSLPNTINAGQSFSVASGFAVDSVAVVLGSMGAGGVGGSLSYQELVNFSVDVATDPSFTFALLDNKSLGNGFDSATFQIIENGNVLENKVFTDLASAQAFFSDNLINLTLLAGLNIIQLSFNEIIGGGDGFAFDYAAISPIITPLPTTLPLFATGLAGLGLLGWRRKKKAIAA